jgi:uncharacterized membrane protein
MKCDVCQKNFQESNLISASGIQNAMEDLIRKNHPNWNDKSKICKNDFNAFRIKYITHVIEKEKGSIEELEATVIKSIQENEFLTFDINDEKDSLSLGEKISDKVASFGGSWKFISIFFFLLIGWIILNSILVIFHKFDPYPFILLNLILSCIAAIQAPIIMMSQNRQEAKDRIRAENDYKINLKSEIEIRTLHEKVDHLLLDQWSKMMEIQEIQIEILEDIRKQIKTKK